MTEFRNRIKSKMTNERVLISELLAGPTKKVGMSVE